MTYDGHGRLSISKSPIEGSAGTTYIYNPDDTIQKIWDARGAHSNYTYNGRHLVRTITYTVPTNNSAPKSIDAVSDTPPVEIQYDAAGNRLWMTDGMGRVDYVFNTWSRLTSETRTFSELTGSYTLGYEYNLAGGLTKLTDPFNSAVNYSFNNSGQLSGVTASAFPGVSTFASGMLYRAWGGLKHGSY